MSAYRPFFPTQAPYEITYVCQQSQPKVNFTPSCQNLYTLMKSLTCRCTAPAVAKTGSLHGSVTTHLLCVRVHACAYVCLCAHRCTDILRMEDYASVEQGDLKREMKGNKRSYSFDISKHLCLWQKSKTNKRNSQSYTPKPSQFLQRANKDFFFSLKTDACLCLFC